MVFDDGYQIIGFIGTLMFPIATAAQTWKAFATKSAADISYGWQVVYTVAEILYIIYAWHFKLWVIVAPASLELVILIVMIMEKYYFDNIYQKHKSKTLPSEVRLSQDSVKERV